VELNEAVRRILGQYALVICACVALGLAAAAFAHRNDIEMFTASTRFVLDTQDPKSQQESQAIADTAKAIATSPSQISGAVSRAHATGRESSDALANRISVGSLGSSGVLRLSVSDPNGAVAARLADELTRGVIDQRLGVTQGQFEEAVSQLDRRTDEITRRIASLDRSISALTVKLAAEQSPQRANAVRMQRDNRSRQRDLLAQRRSVLESQRAGLLSTYALGPRPAIISRATLSDQADSSGLVPDLILGALLGLVLGVGLAGLIETFSPTLVGGDAIAAELDAPLLGALSGDPTMAPERQAASRVAARVRLAAKGAGRRSVVLLSAPDELDLRSLAVALDAAPANAGGDCTLVGAHGPTPGGGGAGALQGDAEQATAMRAIETPPTSRSRSRIRIRSFEAASSSQASNGSVGGLVVIAPTSVKRTKLAGVKHLLRVSRAPLLGIVTYPASRASLGALRSAPRTIGDRRGR
jgi:capsular polysaccharide biosynthesis protein